MRWFAVRAIRTPEQPDSINLINTADQNAISFMASIPFTTKVPVDGLRFYALRLDGDDYPVELWSDGRLVWDARAVHLPGAIG